MSTVTASTLIDAPVAEVWRLLADLTNRADWLSTVGEVEVLTRPGFGPGTAWRETRAQPDGNRQAEEFIVIESAPPGRLVLASPGRGVDYRITWTLASGRRRRRRGGIGTVVTVQQRAVPTAPTGRVLALLLGGLAARTVEGALRADLADLAVAARQRSGGGSVVAA